VNFFGNQPGNLQAVAVPWYRTTSILERICCSV